MFPFVDEFLNLVFPLPRECPLCRAPGPPEVCASCRAVLEAQRQAGFCRRCGRFSPALPGFSAAIPAVRPFLCPECGRRNRPYVLVRAAGLYDGPLKEAVHRFKYEGRRSLAVPLAGLLAGILAGPEFAYAGFACAAAEGCTPAGPPSLPGNWAIIPVPIARGRLRERGFNQAALLARQLARRLNLPLVENALVKRRETAQQVGLSHRDREKNLAGAFSAAQSTAFLGKNTLLIDDVFTTGSTISSAAEVLLRAGAGQVYGLVLASGRFA